MQEFVAFELRYVARYEIEIAKIIPGPGGGGDVAAFVGIDLGLDSQDAIELRHAARHAHDDLDVASIGARKDEVLQVLGRDVVETGDAFTLAGGPELGIEQRRALLQGRRHELSGTGRQTLIQSAPES